MQRPQKSETKHFLNIYSLNHLAKQLSIPKDEITNIVDDIKHQYRVQLLEKIKTDNSIKRRQIYHPSTRLKHILKAIDRHLLQRIILSSSVHGGRKNHSPLTNATCHIGKRYVQALDIRDFYPSISPKSVYNMFTQLNCSPDIARIITRLCTADGHLPQGYNTSPRIAILCLQPAIARIEKLCKGQGLEFSVFVDDLTVSGNKSPEPFVKSIKKILKQYGFILHSDKTVVMKQKQRQTVTGIVVNNKPNLPANKYRELRQILHRCRAVGPCVVMQDNLDKHGDPFCSLDKFRRHLIGRVAHIRSINELKGDGLKQTLEGIDWNNQI